MDPSAVTVLLARIEEGDREATDELYRIAYGDLRRRAEGMLAGGGPHTLQATALVNEAWIRLNGPGGAPQNRSHFLGVAAKAMRSVLVDHARAKQAQKRGGESERLELEEAFAAYEERAIDVLSLHDALERLGQLDGEMACIVELRFFGGLSNAEVADVTGVSVATVERRWTTARAWLRANLEPDDGDRS